MVFLLQADVNIQIVTTRPFSLPCYLQGSENGRVVTIGKPSRLNRQIYQVRVITVFTVFRLLTDFVFICCAHGG
jgi:hypothetical protein